MLSLISLNLEKGCHRERNLPWFREQTPDVVCMQELLEEFVGEYEEALGMSAVFVPETRIETYEFVEEKGVHRLPALEGIAIFTKHSVETRHIQLRGSQTIETYERDNYDSMNIELLIAEVEHEGGHFRIATTHLPKSQNGNETVDVQREVRDRLLEEMGHYDDIILTGDLNAPRGYEIFESLTERYTDAIPAHFQTSIDNALHKSGHKNLQYMVDGLFHTPHYKAHDVELVFGLSDHAAVKAEIERVV